MPTIANDLMPIGYLLPSFALPDVVRGGGPVVSHDIAYGKQAFVVMFICRHCPYVARLLEEIVHVAVDYLPRGAAFVAISSNDSKKYPEDAPEMLRRMAIEHAIPFPLLFDQSQEVAKAFSAVCTPDFFLFDSCNRLFYHGCLDESTPGNGLPVTGKNLRVALDAVLEGRSISEEKIKMSIGCSIKWLES